MFNRIEFRRIGWQKKLSSSHTFVQENITVLCDGMRRYPSQLPYPSEVPGANGFQTNPQTAHGSSFHHSCMEQGFPVPSEQLQSLCAHTYARQSDHEAVPLWGHNHIPCTNSYLSRFRPHKQSFPVIHQ